MSLRNPFQRQKSEPEPYYSDWSVGDQVTFWRVDGASLSGTVARVIGPGPDPVLKQHRPLRYNVSAPDGGYWLVMAHDIVQERVSA